jgi:signal transduction histidine kinase
VTVRTRLVVTMAGMAVLVALPALYGVSRLAEVRDIALSQRGRHGAAFSALGRLQTRLSELDRFQRSYIAAPNEDLRAGMQEALGRSRANLQRLAEVGYEDVSEDATARIEALATATARIEELVEAGDVQEATAYFESIKPLFGSAQESLDELGRAIDARSRADAMQANMIAAAAASTTLIALLVALTLALGLGAWVTTAVTRPLRRLQTGIAGVTEGRLESPSDLPYRQDDEIGELARSFRAMADRLAELDRIRAEFVSMTSHELKTPINVIGGYAELLDEGIYGPVGDRQKEALAAIADQTRSLTELVNRLQGISRLEAGGFPIEPRPVQPGELLDVVRRTFSSLAKQRGIDFQVITAPDTPETILVDPDRLRNEVLGNLLSNAFKFTDGGGRVRVWAGREADSFVLEVSDTGVGIPAADLPHVFDKFYQVGDDAKSRGTGLGLAIARQVVLDHGGRISARSEPGEGTTFRVLLPIGAE